MRKAIENIRFFEIKAIPITEEFEEENTTLTIKTASINKLASQNKST